MKLIFINQDGTATAVNNVKSITESLDQKSVVVETHFVKEGKYVQSFKHQKKDVKEVILQP